MRKHKRKLYSTINYESSMIAWRQWCRLMGVKQWEIGKDGFVSAVVVV